MAKKLETKDIRRLSERKGMKVVIDAYESYLKELFENAKNFDELKWHNIKKKFKFELKDLSNAQISYEGDNWNTFEKKTVHRIRKYLSLEAQNLVAKIDYNSSRKGTRVLKLAEAVKNIENRIFSLDQSKSGELYIEDIYADKEINKSLSGSKIELKNIRKRLSDETNQIIKDAMERSRQKRIEQNHQAQINHNIKVKEIALQQEEEEKAAAIVESRNDTADSLVDFLIENEDDISTWNDLYNDPEVGPLMKNANMTRENFSEWSKLLTRDDVNILESLD